MRIFLALVGGYVLSIFYRSFLTVIATPLKADLGLNDAQFGSLGSIWFFVFACAQFPVGYALDRFGPRLTAIVPMAIGATGGALFAMASGFPSAAIAMAMIGLGCAPVFMAAVYLFARTAPQVSFSFLVSMFISIGSLGNLVSAAPLARAAEAYGWRNAMLGIAVLFAVATVVALILLRDPARGVVGKQGDSGQATGFWRGIVAMLSLRPLWLIAPLAFFGYAVLATERGLWVAPFLKEVFSFSQETAGDGAFAMALGMTSGAVMFGALDKRLTAPKNLASIGTGIAGVAFLGLAAFGSSSAWLAIGLLVVIGVSAFTYALILAHARQFFPEHLIGRGVTAMNFLFIAGGGVVQAASGSVIGLMRQSGMAADSIYAWLHGGFGAILLLCLLPYLLSAARPTKARI